ncbi:unnamed protein product [Rhizophagus irregularis]|nr:unnamed protein product [Rhizophagus irregularis]CAB4410338.1 unnamed protein product [Rhizophagus irregularis]
MCFFRFSTTFSPLTTPSTTTPTTSSITTSPSGFRIKPSTTTILLSPKLQRVYNNLNSDARTFYHNLGNDVQRVGLLEAIADAREKECKKGV